MTYKELADFINFHMPDRYRQAPVQAKVYWEFDEWFMESAASGVQVCYDQSLKDFKVWMEFNNE